MAKVIIYSSANCPYCVRAKALLDQKSVQYEEIYVDQFPEKREEMVKITGKRTVPQIIIDNQSIGGYDDLYALEVSGELAELLK